MIELSDEKALDPNQGAKQFEQELMAFDWVLKSGRCFGTALLTQLLKWKSVTNIIKQFSTLRGQLKLQLFAEAANEIRIHGSVSVHIHITPNQQSLRFTQYLNQ